MAGVHVATPTAANGRVASPAASADDDIEAPPTWWHPAVGSMMEAADVLRLDGREGTCVIEWGVRVCAYMNLRARTRAA
jgi:hypothetical protein